MGFEPAQAHTPSLQWLNGLNGALFLLQKCESRHAGMPGLQVLVVTLEWQPRLVHGCWGGSVAPEGMRSSVILEAASTSKGASACGCCRRGDHPGGGAHALLLVL